MTAHTADQNPRYWAEYSNLQRVKHAIIENYLNGWYPKLALGRWGAKRLVYIDTHAGRGKHLRGQLGSPLVAITTLLNHNSCEAIASTTDVQFLFIERDAENVRALQQELSAVSIPENVHIRAESGDSFQIIDTMISSFSQTGRNLAPSFIFVDPYGFKLPGRLLHRLMQFEKVELFVNVIWRELDMAIIHAKADPDSRMATTMREIFNGDGWMGIGADEHDARAEECASLFREVTGARWGTSVWMRSQNRIRYFLLHLTNHDAGRDLMKECIWKACPDGGYYASKSDNPSQQLLIRPDPDLAPLREWVRDQLSIEPVRWQRLAEILRAELWLNKHLNQVVRAMRKGGELTASEFKGTFAFTNNPLLRLTGRASV